MITSELMCYLAFKSILYETRYAFFFFQIIQLTFLRPMKMLMQAKAL